MTRKGSSKYEGFRGEDGKIDYVAVQAWKRKLRRLELEATKSERREFVLQNGTRIDDGLVCPVCMNTVPLHVRTFPDGTPFEEMGHGFLYKEMPDGSLQRRFSGPPRYYKPVVARYNHGSYGTFVNPEESLCPSMLRVVDEKLYNEFVSLLERTLEWFIMI
jgi:hypothetical protein